MCARISYIDAMTRTLLLALTLSACTQHADGWRSHLNIEKPERPVGSTLMPGLGGRRQ